MSDISFFDNELFPLSIVIATLGGDTLVGTIEHLNRGKIIPAEILVCIPEDELYRVESISLPNVKIIKIPFKGQVAQRAYGLRCASQPLVLQLDDDVVLRREDLQILVQSLAKLGHGHAVAPLFYDLSTGLCMTQYNRNIAGLFQSVSAFLICGAPWGTRRMGGISPAGLGYGVDKDYCGFGPVETQWLPGGCVLCYKIDLITEDYYPFVGKAYAEDLIHSVLWRQQGVRLWVIPNAAGMTSVASMPFSLSSMKQVMLPHVYLVRLIGGKVWRLKLWYAVHVLKQIILIASKRALLNIILFRK